jgi:hypothetical protein
MQAEAPLTFRTPITDPFTIASLFMYGFTAAFGLHATVFPEYKDVDFSLYLCCLGAFVLYSVCHIGWLWWLRLFPRRRTCPTPPSRPGTPPEGASVPVPVRPQPPVLHKSEAKELPLRAESESPVSFIGRHEFGNQ